MEQGILIYKNIHEVYGAVEDSLRKALKLKGPLLDQESIYHMPSLKGERKVRQVITVLTSQNHHTQRLPIGA